MDQDTTIQVILDVDQHAALKTLSGNQTPEEFVRFLIWQAISDTHYQEKIIPLKKLDEIVEHESKRPHYEEHNMVEAIFRLGTRQEIDSFQTNLRKFYNNLKHMNR